MNQVLDNRIRLFDFRYLIFVAPRRGKRRGMVFIVRWSLVSQVLFRCFVVLEQAFDAHKISSNF
jgi:hypothetical protein